MSGEGYRVVVVVVQAGRQSHMQLLPEKYGSLIYSTQ